MISASRTRDRYRRDMMTSAALAAVLKNSGGDHFASAGERANRRAIDNQAAALSRAHYPARTATRRPGQGLRVTRESRDDHRDGPGSRKEEGNANASTSVWKPNTPSGEGGGK